ncbi:hypothetical protein J4E86_010097 [Alternaria arbusti]|uniref:uncharacterized protein n=1 Tax=Alternaria arbusti TaxID=232088 RepID=UPI00221F541D|nr:uncharacterized protein J4E86_010097 [Alternaria arbusti]KAI4942295.1 hypothetical protein J4E86_010097 [Alternaria arbusti]
MSSHKEKFYFLAPPDTPAKGPIFLGGIIKTPKNADAPLNNARMPIDQEKMPIYSTEDHAQSFSFSKQRDFSTSIWASFLRMIFGIGCDVQSETDNRESEEWKVKTLKTMSFNPTPDYIRQSLDNSDVKKQVADDANWLGRTTVYMITGLKLAYGASSIVKYSKSKGLELRAGIDATTLAIPAEGGSNIGGAHIEQVHLSTEKKSPITLAFRIQEIKVRSSGDIANKPVSGGMLGMPEEQARAVDPVFDVEGLEECDANAADFGIVKSWVIEESDEIYGCALASK